MMMKWIIITAIALTMVLMIMPLAQGEDNFTQRDNIVYFNFEGLNQTDIVDFSWDYGDGYGSKSNGVHVYKEDGSYLISLFIMDSEGNTTRIDRWITIGQADNPYTPAHSIRHPYIDNGALYLPFKTDLVVQIPFGGFILCGVIIALSYIFEIKTPIQENSKLPISMILILFGLWIGFWGVSFP
jgi:hypothetical protein